jgi:hypothetical protein
MTLYGSEASHRRALVLSEVTAEGASGLARVLRRAAAGEEGVAALPMGTLVRSVRALGALDARDFLKQAHIRDAEPAGGITPEQRAALLGLVDRHEQRLRVRGAF